MRSMPQLPTLLLLLLVCRCNKLAVEASAATPLVTTLLGDIQGVQHSDGVDAFLGIPFARVGERFSVSTVMDEPYTTPLNATQAGPWCYQPLSPGSPAAAMDEECLYLNIWRPSNVNASARLSTMVWIHGGGFVNGSGDQYDGGTPFMLPATHNMIFVSLNYRLGTLGFLVKDANGTGGMNGIEDQINALKWINTHIEAFGGDASDITLVGESAGSLSAAVLCVSPLAKGLFRRAILQSGTATGGWEPMSPSDGYEKSNNWYLKELGAQSWQDLVDPAAFSAQQIVTQAPDMGVIMRQIWPRLRPRFTLDNRVLSESPLIRFQNAEAVNPVDMIVGYNSYDSSSIFYLDATRPLWENDNLVTTLHAAFGNDTGSQIYEAYAPTNIGYNDSDFAIFTQIDGDYDLGCPTRELASYLSQCLAGKVYLYEFAQFSYTDMLMVYTGGILPDANYTAWASHASDLAFLFGWGYQPISADNSTPIFTPAEQAVARDMLARWANFAKTGDPNYDAATVSWTPVSENESEGSGAAEVPAYLFHFPSRMLAPTEKVDQCSLLVPFYDVDNSIRFDETAAGNTSTTTTTGNVSSAAGGSGQINVQKKGESGSAFVSVGCLTVLAMIATWLLVGL